MVHHFLLYQLHPSFETVLHGKPLNGSFVVGDNEEEVEEGEDV